MQLRHATMEDALAVLAWRNDPQTVAASKTGPVDQAAHLAWFAKAIASPDRVLFIGCEDGRRIGMVRFDRTDDGWLVSINVATDERGKGYGGRMLREAMAEVRGELRAEIKPGNLASIRIFEACGFHRIGRHGGMLRYRRVPRIHHATGFDTADLSGQ